MISPDALQPRLDDDDDDDDDENGEEDKAKKSKGHAGELLAKNLLDQRVVLSWLLGFLRTGLAQR